MPGNGLGYSCGTSCCLLTLITLIVSQGSPELILAFILWCIHNGSTRRTFHLSIFHTLSVLDDLDALILVGIEVLGAREIRFLISGFCLTGKVFLGLTCGRGQYPLNAKKAMGHQLECAIC